MDFLLLTALEILESEVCTQCGQYVWICRSERNDLEFKVNSTTCYGARALEQKRFSMMDSDAKKNVTQKDKQAWGVTHSLTPTILKTSDNQNLPTRAEFYGSQLVE